MSDPDRYAITVRKVSVDGEQMWRATVRELPDLAEFADSRDEATAQARDAIEDLQAAAVEEGRAFPEPLEEEEEFSGRVTLRMSKSMHRDAVMRATDEGVSLNSYVIECVASKSRPPVASRAIDVRDPNIGHTSYDYSKLVERAMSSVMIDVAVSPVITRNQIAVGTATQYWESAVIEAHLGQELRRTG